MKLSISWLRKHIETDVSDVAILNHLTSIGLEIENFLPCDDSDKRFVVGKIVDIKQHPYADTLHICNIDVGKEDVLQIVCGASNISIDLKVVVALVGAVIPNSGLVIKDRMIRNIKSSGMICSASELKLDVKTYHNVAIIDDSNAKTPETSNDDNNNSGILILNDSNSVGSIFSINNCSDDIIFDVNITPNRGDCASAYGLCRDLSGSGIGTLLNPLNTSNYNNIVNTTYAIKNIKNEIIPVFASLELRDISYLKIEIDEKEHKEYNFKNKCKNFSDSYVDIVTKLNIVDIESVNIITDIANFATIDLGLPINIHDLDKIVGNIKVDIANNNEIFLASNNVEYILDDSMLVLRDEDSIISILGIIGSSKTAINSDIANVFLECCYLDPENIMQTGQKLNILSESRFRYERGVDVNLIEIALQRFVNLARESCKFDATKISVIKNKNIKNIKINYKVDSFEKIIGTKLDKDRIIKILQDLEFEVSETDNDDFLYLTAPSYRHDIHTSEDVVEEIARIVGYDEVLKEVNLITPHANIAKANDCDYYQKLSIKRLLATLGYNEIISMSFISSSIASLFCNIYPDLCVKNPLNKNMNYMRPSILPGLLCNALQNIRCNRGRSISFFEIGNVFDYINGSILQKEMLCAIRLGKRNVQNHLCNYDKNFDVFDIKSDLNTLLQEIFNITNIKFDAALIPVSQIMQDELDIYHPYRTFTMNHQSGLNVIFGEIHPRLLQKMDIDCVVNFFSIDFHKYGKISIQHDKCYKKYKLQPLIKDIAFIFDKSIIIGAVVSDILESSFLITEVFVSDVYDGDVMQDGKKSVMFTIEIQPHESLLNANDVSKILLDITNLISVKYAGILRGTIDDFNKKI